MASCPYRSSWEPVSQAVGPATTTTTNDTANNNNHNNTNTNTNTNTANNNDNNNNANNALGPGSAVGPAGNIYTYTPIV